MGKNKKHKRKKYNRNSLGARMKTYEAVSKIFLTPGIPKIVRLDMRAGHTFCRDFVRPFDDVFSECMIHTTKELCAQVTGVVMGYTQSDEISLVINDVTEEGNINSFFNGNVEKIVSVSASIATIAFNKKYMEVVQAIPQDDKMKEVYEKNLWTAQFDSRVFCLPNVTGVHNYILWRQNDATRNSIQMAGHACFTQKQMHAKDNNEIQDMLMLEKGINWNDFPAKYKRGSMVVKEFYEKEAVTPDGVSHGTAIRSRWVEREIPVLTKDRTLVEDIFNRRYPCLLAEGGETPPDACAADGNPSGVGPVDKKEIASNPFFESIDELGLSVRIWKCLKNAGIETIGALCQKTRGEVDRIKNLGTSGVKEIEERLAQVGLALSNGDPGNGKYPFEALKKDIWTAGWDSIEDFLGFEVDRSADKDTVENMLDEVYNQMPEEVYNRFAEKYGKCAVGIESLGLSHRAYGFLKKGGINTVEDLCGKSKEELSDFKGLGKKTVEEIVSALGDKGLSLRDTSIVKGRYVSVWDFGEVGSDCMINTRTKQVFDIEPADIDISGDADLVREYIELPGGIIYPVKGEDDLDPSEYDENGIPKVYWY